MVLVRHTARVPTESRGDAGRHFHETPTGRNLVFGAHSWPSMSSRMTRTGLPSSRSRPGTVPLVESEYR